MNTPVTIAIAICVAQVSQYQAIRIVIDTGIYTLTQMAVAHDANKRAGAIELAEQFHFYTLIDPR
ncbi:MAG: hypothetical protein RMK99_16440 [Anaerolineales bacterium]|nr:hypothetical protein [Anaerolineales bacterium]